MPNKRKTGKTVVSLWLTEEERKTLEKAASDLGMNYSNFIRYAMQELAKRRGITNNKEQQDDDNSKAH